MFQSSHLNRYGTRYLRMGIGLLLSCIALILLLNQIELSVVWGFLQTASPVYILLGVSSVCLNIFAKVFRWHVLLGKRNAGISIKKLMGIMFSGQLINAIFPGRLGDIGRTLILGKLIGRLYVLGTIVLEKWMDTVGFGVLFFMALWLFPFPIQLQYSINGVFWGTILVGGGMALLIYFAKPLRVVVTNASKYVSSNIQKRIKKIFEGDYFVLDSVTKVQFWFWASFWTMVIWITAVINNYFGMRALSVHLPISVAVILLIGLQLGIIASASPGAIGVFEYVCMLILTNYGVEQNLAIGVGLLLHVLIYLPLLIGGIWSIFVWEITLPIHIAEG